jgi:hypothetical protein
MKIEIDTNKDSYPDWLRIQKFVEEFYQSLLLKISTEMNRKSEKK